MRQIVKMTSALPLLLAGILIPLPALNALEEVQDESSRHASVSNVGSDSRLTLVPALVSVLLAFDESGFSLRRVIWPNIGPDALEMLTAVRRGSGKRDLNASNDARLTRSLPAANEAELNWIDENGHVLLRQPVDDPRTLRAPLVEATRTGAETSLTSGSPHGASITRNQGVVLLRGPLDAVTVRLSLPVLNASTTAASTNGHGQVIRERWSFDLR